MRRRNTRRVHGLTAAKESSVGSGVPPDVWTFGGCHRRSLPSAVAKFDALLENLKAKGASSIQGTQNAVRRINLARQDVVFSKCARTWMVFGTILAGFTVGSTWVVPLEKKERVRAKREP
ncbi:hypothetical protein ACP70R_014641 [Stipagrostis hirtigluma subsp. patula]